MKKIIKSLIIWALGNTYELSNSKDNITYSTKVKIENKDFTLSEIEGTPFDVVKQGEVYYIVLKNTKISEDYNTEKEAVLNTLELSWFNIVRTTCTVIEMVENIPHKQTEKDVIKLNKKAQ